MATATIDGLKVEYSTRGSGPALLMLAPGGFDASMDKWQTGSAWKGMNALDALARAFTVLVYDRRESGVSGGRVERLSWALYADQARHLLEHLGIRRAFVMGGCMGCSVATAFAARHPEATHALVLHWPVGGYRWKLNGADRFVRHARFAREQGLAGVVKRAHELMAMRVPALIVAGDDPAHATSGAHYLRELLPQPELWPVMPPEQTTERVVARIAEFGRAHPVPAGA